MVGRIPSRVEWDAYFCTQLYAPKSWWSMRGTMKELCQICVLLVEIAFWAMAVGSTSSELVPAKWTYVLVGLCNLLWHWRGPTNMHSCFNLPPAAESDASPSHTNLSVNASTSLSSKCTVWCADVPKTSAVGGSQINQTFAAIHKIDPFHSCTLAAFIEEKHATVWKVKSSLKDPSSTIVFFAKSLGPSRPLHGSWQLEDSSCLRGPFLLQSLPANCNLAKSVGCDVHCSNNRWEIWCTFAHHVFIVAARRVISNRNRSKSGETWTNSSCHIILSPLRRALEWLGASP